MCPFLLLAIACCVAFLRQFKPPFPLPETFAAICVKLRMIFEVQLATAFYAVIQFAIVAAVFAADQWTCGIDSTVAIGLQVLAVTHDSQKPAFGILEQMNATMGYLPQQMIEIAHRTRCNDLLRGIPATMRRQTALTFVTAG